MSSNSSPPSLPILSNPRQLYPKFNFNRLKFTVTGAGGYVGRRLVRTLLRAGAAQVIGLDIRKPPNDAWHWEGVPDEDWERKEKPRLKFIEGDIRNRETVSECVKGSDAIFHIASYGMSGREQLDINRVRSVNVEGTKLLLKAMQKEPQCKALVYTSTTNVIFVGKPLVNQDESLPYPPEQDYVDVYSKTKAEAEKIVLNSNGIPKDPSLLNFENYDDDDDTDNNNNNNQVSKHLQSIKTCSLRVAGIYGEGEERHFPRFIQTVQSGLYLFAIGSRDSLCEFIYVDNLVHAHILAMIKLLDTECQQHKNVEGRPFFVSDCKPINNFDLFHPIIEVLGMNPPKLFIPVSIMYPVALLIEILHRVIAPIYNFQPLLTRTEVYKVGVTHYFKPDVAHKTLGYSPIVSHQEGLKKMTDFYTKHKDKYIKRKTSWSPILLTIFIVIVSVILLLPQREKQGIKV